MSTSLLQLNPATSAAATAQQYALAQTSAIATARAQRQGDASPNCRPACSRPCSRPRSSCACSRSPGGYGRPAISITMAALQAALVTVGVVVVFQLNNPFTGPLATGPDPIASVASQIGASQSGAR